MKWSVIFKKEVSLKSISLVIILLWFMWVVFYSLINAINLPTRHLDGAFQTASGLFRLDDGQFPGRDFFPYLGIGPLYLLFPVYKLFGSNLASSVIAGYLTVTTLAMLSTGFIFHMIWKPKSILMSMAVSCILIYVVAVTHVNVFTWALTPGNSLRPLRSFAPYLAAIISYQFIFRISGTRLKYTAAGMLTAAVLLWSNDFAFTTALLLGIFILMHSLLQGEFTIKNWGWYVGATLILWSGLFYLACHGHPIEMLKYNFADVAQDQWWYFAPYSEGSRVFSFLQSLKLLFRIEPLGLIVFGLLSLHAIKYKSFESALLLWVGFALFAGGIVASIGGHIDSGYFAAYRYWLLMVSLLGSLRLIWIYLRGGKYLQLTINNQQLLQLSFSLLFLLRWQ